MLDDSSAMQLVSRYGYLAVLAGTMLEGETVVLVAGFLAHQGYLTLPWIMICAVIGSCTSDQGLFFLSRFRGDKLLARFPSIATRLLPLTDSLSDRPGALAAFALFFRFFYGLRNIAPVFLGMSAIPTLRFVALNAVGAVVWAVTFSLLGFVFARTLQTFVGSLARYEMYLAAGLIALGILWSVARRWRRAKKAGRAKKT